MVFYGNHCFRSQPLAVWMAVLSPRCGSVTLVAVACMQRAADNVAVSWACASACHPECTCTGYTLMQM